MDIISAFDALEAADVIQLSRQVLQSIEGGPDCLALLAGDDFECVYANAAFARAAERESALGQAFFDLFPELEGQGVHALFKKIAARRRPWTGRARKIGLERCGVLQWHVCDVALRPVLGMAGQSLGLLVHCRDVRAPRGHGAECPRGRDRLTGLADHDTFLRALEQVLAGLPERGGGMAVALDINRFYRVNACVGQAGGDRLLCELGGRLRDAAGAGTVVARAGANRFLFLFDPRDGPVADAPARLAEALAAPFHEGGLAFYLSACFGTARFPEHGASAGQIMAALDHALAEARRAGPGAVREGVYAGAREREHACLSLALRAAIDNGGIDVHYQPQVDLKSGAICGVEALVRWTDPVAGNVPADTIVRLAEDAGLIGRLGERVLRMACAQAQSWREMGFRDLRVAVNLSASQISMHSLERTVRDALEHTGLPPANLDLELTESVVMDDVARAVACFERLKRHGVQLSLDDFGTGYSSLAYLRLFPIDTLKIDRLFLDLVPGNARAAGLVDTIIATAHGLGVRVIAEGVEHEAQLRFLARGRCDEIQGYFFSKPLPPGELTAMLTARRVLPPWLRRKALHAPVILLVDADPHRRSALGALAAQLLERGGRVVYAGSAAEAIRVFGEAPDLIVAGPRLLGMPGTAFLRLARELCPAAARILLLGGGHAPHELPTEAELADVVLRWPARRKDLLESMRAILH